MKLGLCVSILAVVSVVTVTYASGQSKQSQQGTIVQVQKQDVADPAVRTGAAATRAPLQSHHYLYNVSVQLNCFCPGSHRETPDVPGLSWQYREDANRAPQGKSTRDV